MANCSWAEYVRLRYFMLQALRRLTCRMDTHQMVTAGSTILERALSTISSLVFRELVLELGFPPFRADVDFKEGWSNWQRVDRLLEERFAERFQDFKLIIRKSDPHHLEIFQRDAVKGFPLLAGRGCIHFE